MPAAVAVPAIVGAAGSIGGALIGSSASKKAAQQQSAAYGDASRRLSEAVAGGQAGVGANIGIANDLLKQGLGNYAPYLNLGTTAAQGLQSMAGMTPAAFQWNPNDVSQNPGYQFTLQQGQQALQRAQAAKGNLFSSGTLKSLAGYTTGTAQQYQQQFHDQALQDYLTNYQTQYANKINTLQGLAGLGMTGANATQNIYAGQAQNSLQGAEFGAQLGVQGAQANAGLLTGQGNAQAAGTMGTANAWSSGIGGAATSIGNAYTRNDTLNRLAKMQPGQQPYAPQGPSTYSLMAPYMAGGGDSFGYSPAPGYSPANYSPSLQSLANPYVQ